jgi:hypothetical protein
VTEIGVGQICETLCVLSVPEAVDCVQVNYDVINEIFSWTVTESFNRNVRAEYVGFRGIVFKLVSINYPVSRRFMYGQSWKQNSKPLRLEVSLPIILRIFLAFGKLSSTMLVLYLEIFL